MSKPIFTWHPDLGAIRTSKPTINPTKFGDNYELRVPTGINSNPKSWALIFTTNTATAQQILDFLDARCGSEAFTWTDTLNVTANYVCRDWTGAQVEFGVYSITATFEQVFES